MKRSLSFLALLAMVANVITTPPAVGEPTTSSFIVQKWHTGIWVSWDKSSLVKSALVTAVAEDEINANPLRYRFRNTIGEFTYIPLSEMGPSYQRTILVSIIAMDLQLDGKTQPPACEPFMTWPSFKPDTPGKLVPQTPTTCLSESIYRVTIDIKNGSTKPVQLPGVFLGQRPRNPYVSTDCFSGSCSATDLKAGHISSADIRAFVREPSAKTILFVDSLFFGLPKYTDVYLEVQRKDGKWINLGGQELSTSYSYFAATSQYVPVGSAYSTKYRFRAYAKKLKKNVLITPTFNFNVAFTSPTQASTAPMLEPSSSQTLQH